MAQAEIIEDNFLAGKRNIFKELISYSAGTCIFEEDEKGTEAYFIQSGYIELFKYINNKKKVIALLGPGEIFGEISLLDGKARTASATALHESTLLPISRQEFDNALACEDPLTQLLLHSTIRRIRNMHDDSIKNESNDDTVLQDKDIAYTDSKKHASEHVSTLVKISKAVEKKQFQLNYQPIINLKTRLLNGFEVLVRGPENQPEIISPLTFIPLAEESGLIVPLGEWILEYGLKSFLLFSQEAKRYNLPDDFFISINVSPKQLDNEDNVKKLIHIIKQSGVSFGNIKLEITESTLISNPEKALYALNEFHALGVKIAIDDFGTGYSSLSYLNRYPIDTLKIDRSFINEINKGQANQRIVKALVAMAHLLEMDIVAEGVETQTNLDWLANEGCEYGQGYYYSRPIPFKDALKFINSRNSK